MENQVLLKDWKKLLQEALETDQYKPGRLLDVGTGSGFLAIALAELGYDVSGVDISPAMLEIATQRAVQRGLQLALHVGDAMDLSEYDSDSFNVVITRYLTWALPDLQRAYKEWWRVLSPGGRLVVIDGLWNQNRTHKSRNWWRFFAWALILVTEGRRPERKKKDEIVSFDLPVAKLKRPQDDLIIMENLGYQIEKVYPNIYPLVYKGIRGKVEYLKRCYWGPAFMIIADKV
jgi:ubiquinone/menaquinone biosynthesis C-methylase UbiE